MQATEDKLARALALMQTALTESTGLKDFHQKLVAYWTFATHSLPHGNTSPILAALGKMGTGKSQVLSIIENFALRPVRLSLRGMTTPAIRDKLAEAHNATAIVEEAFVHVRRQLSSRDTHRGRDGGMREYHGEAGG